MSSTQVFFHGTAIEMSANRLNMIWSADTLKEAAAMGIWDRLADLFRGGAKREAINAVFTQIETLKSRTSAGGGCPFQGLHDDFEKMLLVLPSDIRKGISHKFDLTCRSSGDVGVVLKVMRRDDQGVNQELFTSRSEPCSFVAGLARSDEHAAARAQILMMDLRHMSKATKPILAISHHILQELHGCESKQDASKFRFQFEESSNSDATLTISYQDLDDAMSVTIPASKKIPTRYWIARCSAALMELGSRMKLQDITAEAFAKQLFGEAAPERLCEDGVSIAMNALRIDDRTLWDRLQLDNFLDDGQHSKAEDAAGSAARKEKHIDAAPATVDDAGTDAEARMSPMAGATSISAVTPMNAISPMRIQVGEASEDSVQLPQALVSMPAPARYSAAEKGKQINDAPVTASDAPDARNTRLQSALGTGSSPASAFWMAKIARAYTNFASDVEAGERIDRTEFAKALLGPKAEPYQLLDSPFAPALKRYLVEVASASASLWDYLNMQDVEQPPAMDTSFAPLGTTAANKSKEERQPATSEEIGELETRLLAGKLAMPNRTELSEETVDRIEAFIIQLASSVKGEVTRIPVSVNWLEDGAIQVFGADSEPDIWFKPEVRRALEDKIVVADLDQDAETDEISGWEFLQLEKRQAYRNIARIRFTAE